MKLNRKQKDHLSDKLMDTANLVLGGLVIGQFVSRNMDPILVIIGLVFYVVTLKVTTSLKRVK